MLEGGGGVAGSRYGAGTPTNPSGFFPVGSSSWTPAKPSSYSATGTVTFSTSLDSGPDIDTLFHPTWQKFVRTGNGTRFAVYLTRDNTNTHSPSSWRLRKSTNDGVSWSTVWDSQTQGAGDPQYGIAPALEIDENDNVYVIANYYTAGQPMSVKMYVFTAASSWAAPGSPITLQSSLASGKWSVFLDQGRQWIWVLFWSHGNSTSVNLLAFNYSGTLQYSRRIFKAYTRDWAPTLNGATDLHAPSAHYPSIFVGVDGTVYVAWTSFAFQGGDFTNAQTSFYDVRMVYSTSTKAQFLASTDTWLGPTNRVSGATSTRTVPFCTDDSSSTDSEIAFPICKLSDQTEFIPASDTHYGVNTGQFFNYSRLFHMVANSGALHFYYESEITDARVKAHHSYARFNLSTNALADSDRRSPNWKCDSTTAGDRLGPQVGEGSGNFVQDTSEANRLYFVTRTLSDADGKILVLRSDDGGVSWWQYAISSAITVGPNGILGVQAYRYVCSDGVILGGFALADSPFTVYTFKVVPN